MHAIASFLALLVLPSLVAAQSEAQPAVIADADRGFALRSADGVSSLRLVGLLQLQYAHEWIEGSVETDTFFVNRARVGMVGSAFSTDLRYTFVAEFGADSASLLFLNVDYTLVADWLTIRIGKFKRPFSRAFIAMAGQLSMIDRPLAAAPNIFGDGVDLGVMLHNGSMGHLEYAVGVFGGSGSGTLPERVDPLVALRVGYNSSALDGYSESDLDGGAPRFGIAVAGLVDFDADGDHESFSSAVVDLVFKAYGLSLSTAFYVGARQLGVSWSDQRSSAIGHYTQTSYLIAGWLELALRYGFLMNASGGHEQHDFAGGLNVYFHGHALKLQNFVSVRSQEETDAPDLRFQSQLSISL